MSDFVPTTTELQLAQMVAVWRQGEAAKRASSKKRRAALIARPPLISPALLLDSAR